jgi:hypothetical protein
MLIEVPDELKSVGEAFEEFLGELRRTRTMGSDGRSLDYVDVEHRLADKAAAIERAGHEDVLRSLDVDSPRVRIRGVLFTRVGRGDAPYHTLSGTVRVTRSLYRKASERTGPVVDPVSLRTGAVGEGWLPGTAKAMAFLVQQAPSREAENACQQLARLPYSRSSFERVAHEVGTTYRAVQAEVEEALIESVDIPKEAKSISTGLDRVSVPMEEPKYRPVGRPRKGAAKRPVERNYRMAYVGTLTLHDAEGEAIRTLRFGRMPQGDVTQLCERMAADAASLLRERPDLKVARLTDGAPEMANRLGAVFSEERLGTHVFDLVDFWHLVEKLSPAAALIYGPDAKARLQRWRLDLLNKEGAVWSILTELHESQREHDQLGDKEPVHDAITYITNNGERMNYAEARRLGLPIGSGNTEATCKTLFDVRLKRSGSRWKEETGEDIVQLRALALSDLWDSGVELALRELRAPVRLAS